jgi:hypothetical protein
MNIRKLLMTLMAATATALAVASTSAQMPPMADFSDHEKLDRDQVIALLAAATDSHKADFYAKNPAGRKLAGVDFKGANLSAAVLNGADLSGAISAEHRWPERT